jgi:hypothetical protein
LEETRICTSALAIGTELSTPAVAVAAEVESVAPPLVLMRAVMVRGQVRYLEGASTKAPETAIEAGEEGRKVLRYGEEEEEEDAGHGVKVNLYGCRFFLACMFSRSDLWTAAPAAGGGEGERSQVRNGRSPPGEAAGQVRGQGPRQRQGVDVAVG